MGVPKFTDLWQNQRMDNERMRGPYHCLSYEHFEKIESLHDSLEVAYDELLATIAKTR